MTTPIEVNPSQLPGIVGTVLRYAVVFAAARGFLPDGTNVEQVVSALIAIGTVGYAIFRTYQNKAHLVTAAEAAPNSVAIVK